MTPTTPSMLGGRLRFEVTGFTYVEHTYPYTDVRHLEFKQHTYSRKDGGKTILSYESYLRLTLESGKRLNIKPETGNLGKMVKTTDKQLHDEMARAADWLGAYTFDSRMDDYERQFKTQGYVRWGKYQIKPSGELFYRHAYCLNLRDENVRCMMYAFHIACMRRPKRWWKRLLGMLLKRGEVLDLRCDRDCFIYFMRKRLGLKWPSETLRVYRGVSAEDTSAQAGAQAGPQASSPNPGQPGGGPQKPHTEQPRQEQKRDAPPPPPPPKTMPSYPQHLATLGLGPDVQWDVVKKTYRHLVRQNHPDLLRGKGAMEKTVKAAEERLKTFNEAYAWLEDFYKLKPR